MNTSSLWFDRAAELSDKATLFSLQMFAVALMAIAIVVVLADTWRRKR
mgnify:FL=1